MPYREENQRNSPPAILYPGVFQATHEFSPLYSGLFLASHELLIEILIF